MTAGIGATVAWVFGVGMAVLGIGACSFPKALSRVYGSPQDQEGGWAWVRAAGLRDLGLLVALGVSLIGADYRAAGVVALVAGLVAVGDFVNVVSLRGKAAWGALIVHASGVLLGLGSGGMLLAGY